MSRIGKKPILIPQGVSLDQKDGLIVVKGPKGSISVKIRPEVLVEVKEDTLTVSLKDPLCLAYWGLTRALLANAVLGVTEGFEKDLELQGVGYRASKEGNDLILNLGFSNPVKVVAPEGIEFEVPDNQNIKVKGIDKQLVGLLAAKIKKLKKPEPYLGKGIKYKGEVIRRKAGKATVK